MLSTRHLARTGASTAMATVAPASAETLRSGVAFNNGIGQKTANQPADGVEVAYQVTLNGGDLDGCIRRELVAGAPASFACVISWI